MCGQHTGRLHPVPEGGGGRRQGPAAAADAGPAASPAGRPGPRPAAGAGQPRPAGGPAAGRRPALRLPLAGWRDGRPGAGAPLPLADRRRRNLQGDAQWSERRGLLDQVQPLVRTDGHIDCSDGQRRLRAAVVGMASSVCFHFDVLFNALSVKCLCGVLRLSQYCNPFPSDMVTCLLLQ